MGANQDQQRIWAKRAFYMKTIPLQYVFTRCIENSHRAVSKLAKDYNRARGGAH
jgi:hypothetical protein